jgi:opacity protein-like surface antigen
MMKTIFRVSLLGAALSSGIALAQPPSPIYLGFDYTTLNTGGTNPTSYVIRGGYRFTDHISAEAHFLTSGSSDGGNKLQTGLAAFVRADLPVGQNFSIYGLLGYGSIDFSVAGTKDTYASQAYGAGITYALSQMTALNLDYISYANSKGLTMCSLNAGVMYSF